MPIGTNGGRGRVGEVGAGGTGRWYASKRVGAWDSVGIDRSSSVDRRSARGGRDIKKTKKEWTTGSVLKTQARRLSGSLLAAVFSLTHTAGQSVTLWRRHGWCVVRGMARRSGWSWPAPRGSVKGDGLFVSRRPDP
ncbi:hypothetical protein BRADI_2g02206v3 [Brachypodium distachyon]|uniref:Uncharacterized protein n=1 Tax=Brachypodium distachyon TaxID=15368 RepID=A0A2K2D6H2_BRADI|nr:hypothetical protein BRADI_2g02206v3 [Brachypodium distachyon]